MATKVQEFVQANPYYVGRSNTTNRTQPAPAPRSRGGLAGFIEGAVRDIAHPFGYLLDASIGNPARELAAQFTGNKEAARNAKKRTLKNLGLGEKGDNLGNALKTWGGNSAQAGLTLLAPSAKSMKGAAAVGAGFGASSAAAREGSTANDIITQSVIGGGLGAAGYGAGKLAKSISGKVSQSANRLESRSSGIGLGKKVDGQRITPEVQKDLEKFAIDRGMPAGHVDNKYTWASAQKIKAGEALSKTVEAVDRNITTAERKTMSTNFRDSIKNNIALKNNKTATQLANNIDKDLRGIRSLSEAVKQKQNLDDLINHMRNNQTATPLSEKVYRNARDELAKFINSEDALKLVNKEYANYSKLTEALGAEADAVGRPGTNAGGGLFSSIRSGDTAQSVKSMTGRAGMALTKAGNKTTRFSNAPKMGLPAYPVSGTLAVRSPGGQPAPQEQDTTLYGEFAQQDGAPMDTQMVNSSPQQMMGLEEALVQAQQILGNKQSPSTYLQYAKAIMDASQQDTQIGPDTTKVTAQQYSLAQRGKQALGQMAELLQNNPQVLDRSATPGRKLPVIGGFISNAAGTGDFDAIGYNIASSLLRIETGAQANESEIRNLQSQMMPRAGDNQQTINRKLQQLDQAFSVIIDAANRKQNSGMSSYIDQLGGLQ